MTDWHNSLAAVFASHYRRNPLQLAGLVLIVMIAAMLWSGVTILTGQARDSLSRSQAAIEPELTIERADGHPVSQQDFATLRRAGVCVTPRLEVTLAGPPSLVLVGLDPLTLECLGQQGGTPGFRDGTALLQAQLRGSESAVEHWQTLHEARDALRGGKNIRTVVDPELPAGMLFGDIGVVAAFGDRGTQALALLLPAADDVQLPPQYRLAVQDYGIASDELAESFLLNLDALGLLALLVSALLIRSVYVFGLSQRQQTLTLLHQAGVPSARITGYLVAELLIISCIGSSFGLLLGTEVAQLFSEGVQSTLTGLFSTESAGFEPPGARTWLQAGLMVMLVSLWACGGLFWDRLPGTFGKRKSVRGIGYGLLTIGGVFAGLVLIALGTELWQLYLGLASSLIATGLLLPQLIRGLLKIGQRRSSTPLLEWSLSEISRLASVMTLPLIALAFAIAAAIGVFSMVTSFEATFEKWLEQRLQGDVYVEMARPDSSTPQAVPALAERFRALDLVTVVHPVVRGSALAAGIAVDAVAVDPGSPLLERWDFLQALPEPWRKLKAGAGIMVNEQLARRQGLSVGDPLDLVVGNLTTETQVLGIYADYGRPTGEVLLGLNRLGASLTEGSLSFVLGMAPGSEPRWPELLAPGRIPLLVSYRDQQEIKALARAAFARTFAITQAMSGLTLLLAGISLALIAYVSFRVRRPVYTLVHVFGLSAAEVRFRLVAHASGLALMLSVLAVPLGVFLTWVLVAQINPTAFGWALPFDLYPMFWLLIIAGSTLMGACVGLLMGNPARFGQLPKSLVLLPFLVMLGGCDAEQQEKSEGGFASLGTSSRGYAQPRPGMTISLPEDMGAHPEYRLEWWYLTANLESEDGRRFGVQWTLFRQSLEPASTFDPMSEWDSNSVWMAHAALSTPDQHHFHEKFARGSVGQAGVEHHPFRAWLDDWHMRGNGAEADFLVRASTPVFGYHLQLTRTGPAVRHGDNGFSAKSPDGEGSLYFSFADLQVEGSITLDGKTHQVSGTGWFDREWSSQLLRSSQEGWDWFAVHLGDGSKLMVFQLRGEEPYFSGTYVAPSGDVQVLDGSDIRLSPVRHRETAKAEIPVDWHLEVPRLDLDLQIESWPGTYWNDGAFPYWEGPVDVSGSHDGSGYLEMTGY